MMTDLACRALAHFVHDLRPDLDVHGIVAELNRQREHYDPWQLAAAMCKRASDPKNLTPQLQAFDRQGFVSCRRHPTAGTRTDGTCGWCYSEAREAPSPAARDRADVGHPLRSAVAAALAELHPEAHT